jgi:hypothetical protein
VAWKPHPKNLPQQTAFKSEADVIGYGGQAGGGKTDLLLGLALEKHYKSVIFRREASQLRDIVERSRQIIGASAKLNESLLVWRGLPKGQTVAFGGIKDDNDFNKWAGRPYDLYGFDEATEFTGLQIRSMIAWNRSTRPRQKCQVVLAFNPPRTVDGRWVIEFFGPWLDKTHPNRAADGEIRWFARIDDKDVEVPDDKPIEHKGELIKPQSRTFIRAQLKDNPFLAGTDYEAKLQSLPEPLRSQLLKGSFDAGVKDDEWQLIPTAWVELAMERWKTRPRPATPMSAMGVDCVYGGNDEMVLSPRYDNWFDELERHAGETVPDGPTAVKVIKRHLLRVGAARIERGEAGNRLVSRVPLHIDGIGYGASAYDNARASSVDDKARAGDEVEQKLRAISINFAAKSEARTKTNTYGFINVRAAAYWKLREMLDPDDGDDIALPPDSKLLGELCAARFSIQSNGIKVEPKDDIKKRLGRSPDSGDAVVNAAYRPPSTAVLFQA